ncbi:hypothetical protein BDQ12DRAFT_687749 [Crucibulum laeve]|uniref:Uncharacterized protein n=1 Tax=Crucibulum laeve TaxID=68775 RepID=A0A5C3LT16_9AGAR|nr:hypothetical protein BDQ12DRAFT_687749 [Crucibulum laeve]
MNGASPKRTSSASSTSTQANLPPPRKSQPMRSVKPPLADARLSKFVYILIILTSLLAAFYSYRVVQHKSEVGGWWNLAMGRRPPQMATPGNPAGGKIGKMGTKPRAKGEDTVEDRINALAQALGMPSNELASAIAVAVKQYVPPASLSSVAAKETGPAVEALVKGASEDVVEGVSSVAAAEASAAGVVGGVVSGMESFVGMDEP